MRDAVIVSSLRTAVGKAPRGTLNQTRPEDLGAAVIKETLKKIPALDPTEIDDLILGCAMPEGEQGLNMSRIIGLHAGLPINVPAMTVNRFCSSGLQTIALASQQISTGMADIIIAGGVESMSKVPMSGHKFSPHPEIAANWPEIYMGMGHTAEEVANRFNITREEQDEFAYRSHQRALAAIASGKFKDEIVPVSIKKRSYSPETGPLEKETLFDQDEGPRADTTLEALSKLRPVFSTKGTVTAGNSSQMSDGAAATLVMSEKKASELGLRPIARMVSYAVAGVPPEIMGIGPVEAIPKALRLAGLNLDDIDLIELNEAFASQSLHIIKKLGLDIEKVNVNGGAIALGHPLGCTGAKLTATLLHELKRRNGRYGMVTMCIGGGMGAAGIFELI